MVLVIGELIKHVVEFMAMRISCSSVDEISRYLGINRDVIENVLENLKLMGFTIEVCNSDSYRFGDLDNLATVWRYTEYLSTRLRYKVHYVEICDSTQDIAMEMAKRGALEGTIVISEELKRGRGRMGRQWIASRGGLWFSLILRPPKIRYINLISLATASSVAQAIRNVLGIDAKIKWPNDVLVNEKKASGILIEGVSDSGGLQYLVVGIGVNVNNDLPQDLQSMAISLKNILNSHIPRVPLLLAILKNLDHTYNDIREEKVKDVLNTWKNICITLGRKVKILTMDGVLEGIAEDIEVDGALRVKLNDNIIKKVYIGDVIHLR